MRPPGTAPTEPLVFLHGIGASRKNFGRLLPGLEKRFEIHSIDLPGHGDAPSMSVRPTVAAITDAVERSMDEAGLGRAHVVGDSLGGRIALELAQRRRALSVVAIAPPGMGLPPERLHQAVVLGGSRLFARLARPVLPLVAKSRAARTLLLPTLQTLPWRSTEEDVLSLRDGLGRAKEFWRMLAWAVVLEVPTGFEEVDCPVTLVQGLLDVIAIGQTPRFLLVVPGSRFRLLPWAGHAPMSDLPEEIVRIIEETADEAGRALQAGELPLQSSRTAA